MTLMIRLLGMATSSTFAPAVADRDEHDQSSEIVDLTDHVRCAVFAGPDLTMDRRKSPNWMAGVGDLLVQPSIGPPSSRSRLEDHA